MKLEGKKELAARALNIGKARIIFNKERLDEIKEAITKNDIKDLLKGKAIKIKEKQGRKKKEKRRTRRRVGSIKKKVNKRKQEYIKLTRKLRTHIKYLKDKGILPNSEYIALRKEIRAKAFRNLTHMKERIPQEKK